MTTPLADSRDDTTALVERARNGDRNAFACLIERQRPAALRRARTQFRTDETARDIVQEATLQAFLSLETLRAPERFGEWFQGIVRNVCRDRHRRYGREPVAGTELSEDILPTAPDTARVAEERAQRDRIQEAIQLLPEASQEAARRFYLDGQTIAEIAAAVDTTPGAIRVRLHDARKRLRSLLVDDFPEYALPLPSATEQRSRTMSSLVNCQILTTANLTADPTPEIASLIADPLGSEQQARFFLLAAIAGLPPHSRSGVFLYDDVADQALSVPVGQPTACRIAEQGKDGDRRQPQPYELLVRLLSAVHASVCAVTLDYLEGGGYYGELSLRAPTNPAPVRTQTADALVLAAFQNVTVRVPATVLAARGWNLTDALGQVSRLLAGDVLAAAREPFITRLADAFLTHCIGNLPFAAENYRGEFFMGIETVTLFVKPHFRAPHPPSVWWRLAYHYTDGDDSPLETPLSLPLVLLPLLTAHFQQRAALDTNLTTVPQTGRFTIPRPDLPPVTVTVTTAPTPEAGESLTLRLTDRDEDSGAALRP